MRKVTLLGILLLFVSAMGIIVHAADPTGVGDLGTAVDSRGDYAGVTPGTDSAYAGNITELFPNITSITQTWQGYYGNISARIVLDNANNQSMYQWDIASPTGTVFAVNETINDWSDVMCFDYVNGTEVNITIFEQDILNCSGDADCVQQTFNTTQHNTIYVGSNSFTNQCNATKTFVNDGQGTKSFDEALLYEPTQNAIIYASVIFNDNTGFDNTPTDFQMLVGENGHGSAASSKTPYYFYIQLT